jgi:orotidine-5'-phosphate decarboxylase
MGEIIERTRSIIPACDVVGLDELKRLVSETHDVEGVGAYKLGLGQLPNLKESVELVKSYTDKPVIYDHQKAGTDLSNKGKLFARVCKDAGVDAVILFPMAGPEVERAWIEAARDRGLGVIVGGRLSEHGYAKSEGGYIDDYSIFRIYKLAAREGVSHFVVPGNRLDDIEEINNRVRTYQKNPTYYVPAIGKQGGRISLVKMKLKSFHAIIGEGIYAAPDIREATLGFAKELYKSY